MSNRVHTGTWQKKSPKYESFLKTAIVLRLHAKTLQYGPTGSTVQLSSVLVYQFPLTSINIVVFVYLHWTTLGKFSFPCLSLPVKGYILS